VAKAKHAETPLVEARVGEVLRLRLSGYRRWDILRFVSEQEAKAGSLWALAPGETPMGPRNVENYISRADKCLRESSEKKRKQARERHLAQRRFLYKRRVEANDDATALAILKDEADLQGLYPPKKTANTNSKGKDLPPPGTADDIMRAVVASVLGLPGGLLHPGGGPGHVPPSGDGGDAAAGEGPSPPR
jgi:hypothetical protein